MATIAKRVGLPSMVDGQKPPFRTRSTGRGRAETGLLQAWASDRGRPRRCGATHAGGGMRTVSRSRPLHT
jgi:hypothetical protein